MKSMLSSIFQSVLASSSKNLVVASSYKQRQPSPADAASNDVFSLNSCVVHLGNGCCHWLDPHWPGICNGMAAGVMLAASFELVNMLCITGCICDEV
ncbi:hypothetical protein Bca52824_054569 [Brassica carinata]|uniref:Uncharacterized protein n=1 Tax=Brassica carinata TaxID=52824 RepID=A0A8X7ULY7_BRACI|nr:hypothetical protein Bca52824_054569 [Brassica carinata]